LDTALLHVVAVEQRLESGKQLDEIDGIDVMAGDPARILTALEDDVRWPLAFEIVHELVLPGARRPGGHQRQERDEAAGAVAAGEHVHQRVVAPNKNGVARPGAGADVGGDLVRGAVGEAAATVESEAVVVFAAVLRPREELHEPNPLIYGAVRHRWR